MPKVSEMNIVNKKYKVLENKKIACNRFKMKLAVCKSFLKKCKPGQFIHIKPADSFDPFLRRPISIHRINNNSIEIIYDVKGKGTKILSSKNKGCLLDIIGPLGNGFYLNKDKKNNPKILIAGGMGAAPLLFLTQKLNRPKGLVLIGARTKNEVICKDEFKNLGCSVKVATDDGSEGFKGMVTELLRRILSVVDNNKGIEIFACGPEVMLKELKKILKVYELDAQVSLENFMGCGIGACLGCAVKTISGYKRVCKDGPVFYLSEVFAK